MVLFYFRKYNRSGSSELTTRSLFTNQRKALAFRALAYLAAGHSARLKQRRWRIFRMLSVNISLPSTTSSKAATCA